MQIEIQARGLALTESLCAHVERRLRLVFGSGHRSLRRIVVRLSDDNGPRGGKDMRCRIQVRIAGASPVVIEDTETSLYVAIDRATDRVGRTVSRRIEKLRTDRRLFRRFPGTVPSLQQRTFDGDSPAAALDFNARKLPA